MLHRLSPYADYPDDAEIARWYEVDSEDVTDDMRADYLHDRRESEAERWADD